MTTKTALGNAHDCCPVEGNGNGLEIGFNNKYMMDALKAAPKDQVTLELSSPITPASSSRRRGGEFPVHGPPRPPQSRFLEAK